MSKRYVQHVTDGKANFKPFKDQGQISDPSLCLWCGEYLPHVQGGARGLRGDNAFCSMRCGYSYGVVTAKLKYNPNIR